MIWIIALLVVLSWFSGLLPLLFFFSRYTEAEFKKINQTSNFTNHYVFISMKIKGLCIWIWRFAPVFDAISPFSLSSHLIFFPCILIYFPISTTYTPVKIEKDCEASTIVQHPFASFIPSAFTIDTDFRQG